MTKPNILWICTDQQRWDTLGVTGNRHVRTPNLDRLFAGGAHFANAYCQSPVCSPSRGSFLTGRYPRTARMRQNGADIPADEVLVTKLLADGGYTCGLSGKLHLSACHPSVAPATERRIDDGYSAFHWSHHPAQFGSKQNWPLNEYNLWLLERGAEYRPVPYQDSKYVQAGPDAKNHQTTWCAEKAITFTEAHAGSGRPWLFSVNMFDPHHPFDPPAEYLDRYMDRLDEIELPHYRPGELDDKPVFQKIDHASAYGGNAGLPYDQMTDRDHRMVRAAYFAMCDLIDDQVGRMIDALEATGQLDNTIVIFMSDHGELLGDHGVYLKGPFFYEPSVHVPLAISWPGQIPARTIEGLVELVDLAPTLLEAAGLPVYEGMQGKSLWPLLTGDGTQTDTPDVYCEYYNAMPWHREPHLPFVTMLRTDTMKLVVSHGDKRGELYDLVADPTETTNLWDEPGMLATRCDLLQRLCDRMAFTVDPLPVRRAPW
ncbi:MAG TPA: sulfatase-like hydrolase/transferase [Devosia sp.]|nr:sulfatase-like hydrolase/transferase [Devosia sp.]